MAAAVLGASGAVVVVGAWAWARAVRVQSSGVASLRGSGVSRGLSLVGS